MAKLDQRETPFVTALKKYVSDDVSPFDVPGHHMGNIDNAATELLGNEAFRCDVNAPIGLDNLAKPSGVILESEKLLAQACGADEAFFLINGTSSGIIAMFLATVRAGEKVILPRNCHKSVINAMILCGAVPVYVMPEIDNDLEIANQPSLADWKKAIADNPSAKAVFVINPTYFGSVGPLKDIVVLAHESHMAVLVDEAHGAHYYFKCKNCPLSAMAAGADISAASFHKTVGSLTQSSVLLIHTGTFERADIQKSLNIINTTSPSSLLMASLDAARSYMASKEGAKAMAKTYELAAYARNEIHKIPGFLDEGKDYFLAHGSYDYDESKLVIGLDRLDIDGFQLYHLLKDKYEIMMELAETYAVLGIFAIGTKKEHVDHLIKALREISAEHFKPEVIYPVHHFDNSFPFMLLRPRVAFHAPGVVKPVAECNGAISKEQIMMYPPGIPLIVPGEVWTQEIIDRIEHYESLGIKLLSAYNNGFEVVDLAKWPRFATYERKLKAYLENRRTTPTADGFHLPFEGLSHEKTLVLVPFRGDTWRNKAIPAQEAFKNVIKAIALHEKVVVGVHPAIFQNVASKYRGIKNVELLAIRYDDAWARDNTPLFVTNGKALRTVDFRFNAWGGNYNGLYRNYKDDDHLAARLSKKWDLPNYYLSNFVLEGGSIAVDGEGTLITTEACLLSQGRNPAFNKVQIEEILETYLGVQKVIWVPHGIYLDETDEHIDNMVSFIKPGEVVMAWTNNKNDPQFEYCLGTFEALKKATDAKGRKLVIHKMLLPDPPLFLTVEESKGLSNTSATLAKREAGRRLAASYINYYQGKDFVVMPAFGVKEDHKAFEMMKKLYPNKVIHQINTKEILLGGGNIHCITMQVPEKEE
jgi:lysine decarboxylase